MRDEPHSRDEGGDWESTSWDHISCTVMDRTLDASSVSMNASVNGGYSDGEPVTPRFVRVITQFASGPVNAAFGHGGALGGFSSVHWQPAHR